MEGLLGMVSGGRFLIKAAWRLKRKDSFRDDGDAFKPLTAC